MGWLLKPGAFDREHVDRAAAEGFFQVCPAAADLAPEQVDYAHRQVKEVRAWGIARLEDVLRTVETGCDGLTINWPDWLVHDPR